MIERDIPQETDYPPLPRRLDIVLAYSAGIRLYSRDLGTQLSRGQNVRGTGPSEEFEATWNTWNEKTRQVSEAEQALQNVFAGEGVETLPVFEGMVDAMAQAALGIEGEKDKQQRMLRQHHVIVDLKKHQKKAASLQS